jgi:hypothetical protein
MIKDPIDYQKYKDAVWSFILEHCDITSNGSLFIKFHTDNRQNFEKRVWARYKHNYHRESPEEKQKLSIQIKDQRQKEKDALNAQYLADKAKRRAEQQLLLKRVGWDNWYQSLSRRPFLERTAGYIKANIWNRRP